MAADFPFLPLLVQQRRVAHQPSGLVEVGGLAGPFDVVGLEPNTPLVGVLAGEEVWEPGGPDVRVLATDGQGRTRMMGILLSLWPLWVDSLRPDVIGNAAELGSDFLVCTTYAVRHCYVAVSPGANAVNLPCDEPQPELSLRPF